MRSYLGLFFLAALFGLLITPAVRTLGQRPLPQGLCSTSLLLRAALSVACRGTGEGVCRTVQSKPAIMATHSVRPIL